MSTAMWARATATNCRSSRDVIMKALADFAVCEDTPDGARILTHCLYPSFTPVPIYVVRFGDGFIVHDNGEAKETAWLHARDSAVATRYLNEQALQYGLTLKKGRLSVTVQSAEWLTSAILAVANGAATAAGHAEKAPRPL